MSYYSSITSAELMLQQEINRPWWLKHLSDSLCF